MMINSDISEHVSNGRVTMDKSNNIRTLLKLKFVKRSLIFSHHSSRLVSSRSKTCFRFNYQVN